MSNPRPCEVCGAREAYHYPPSSYVPAKRKEPLRAVRSAPVYEKLSDPPYFPDSCIKLARERQIADELAEAIRYALDEAEVGWGEDYGGLPAALRRFTAFRHSDDWEAS